MKLVRISNWFSAAILVASFAIFVGCQKPAQTPPPSPAAAGAIDISEPTAAQPKLPTVKLWLGPEQMDAEMCTTPRETQTGMMFRKTMGDNDGMIFSLGYDQQASFWMKNCF